MTNSIPFQISKSDEFKNVCPQFVGAALYASVKNSPTSELLKNEIEDYAQKLQKAYTTESLKNQPGIAATRSAYKAFGKDPSRYRPACEQLARRIVQGKGLYYVNTIVDIVNLASLFSGYSTAALDAAHIIGNNIVLGIGKEGEPYEGIGRGVLNIENLPVYRDGSCGFATPTSDSIRTMINENTNKLLMLINGYDGNVEQIKETIEFTSKLLKKYANCEEIEFTLY